MLRHIFLFILWRPLLRRWALCGTSARQPSADSISMESSVIEWAKITLDVHNMEWACKDDACDLSMNMNEHP